MIFRRLGMVFSIAICGSLAFAAAAIAAGGGLGPGSYSFSGSSANALLGGGKGGTPQPTFSVYVNQGMNSFQPVHPKGPRIVTNSTGVQFSEFDATGVGGNGCFIIPATDFTVRKDLQTAALHTNLTADEACPGLGAPIVASKDVAAYASSGGGGLVLPIRVDVSWRGNGVVSTFKNRSTFQCLEYSEDGTSTLLSSNGGASGATSALKGAFTTDLANVSATNSKLDIKGTSQPACFGY
jgi:hypothetical protein